MSHSGRSCNSTIGCITYTSLSVALAQDQCRGKAVGHNTASPIDFVCCSSHLFKVVLQRAASPLQLLLYKRPHRPHHCNLTKDHITHSSLSVAFTQDQGLPKVFWQTVASPWHCNSTKGHITYSSFSVALADVQGLSKTCGPAAKPHIWTWRGFGV